MEEIKINLDPGKKIYFASDFHLGATNPEESREREQKIVRWLEKIRPDAQEIFLVGDIFDFWFEYKKVIPKGYVRFLGKIANLIDEGIPVHFFHGNHDLWMKDYFAKELGVTIHEDQIRLFCEEKSFWIGHGDGYGPGDYTYKKLKKVFKNRFTNWLFQWLHPNIGIGLAESWSSNSKLKHAKNPDPDMGEKEILVLYSHEIEKKTHHDYYVFGHRHITAEISLNENATYFNLGEWVTEAPFASFDGNGLILEQFES